MNLRLIGAFFVPHIKREENALCGSKEGKQSLTSDKLAMFDRADFNAGFLMLRYSWNIDESKLSLQDHKYARK